MITRGACCAVCLFQLCSVNEGNFTVYLSLVIYYHITKAEIKVGSSPCETENRDCTEQSLQSHVWHVTDERGRATEERLWTLSLFPKYENLKEISIVKRGLAIVD